MPTNIRPTLMGRRPPWWYDRPWGITLIWATLLTLAGCMWWGVFELIAWLVGW